MLSAILRASASPGTEPSEPRHPLNEHPSKPRTVEPSNPKPVGKRLSGADGRGEGGVARLHVDVSAVYLLDFARAPPDTITDSAALSLPEPV